MTIGDRISYLRRSRDLSQEELAEMCGVSRQAVSKWESEQSIPEIDKITTLSEIFGVTTDFILKGIEPLGERPDRKNHPAKPYDIVGTALIILGTVIGCCFSATDYYNDIGLGATLVTFVFIIIGLTAFALGSVRLTKREQKRNALGFARINVWAIAFFVFSLIYNAAAVHEVAPFPRPFTSGSYAEYEPVDYARVPEVTAIPEDVLEEHEDVREDPEEKPQTIEPGYEPSFYSTLPDWVKEAAKAAFVVVYVLTCAGATVYCSFEIERERKGRGEEEGE